MRGEFGTVEGRGDEVVEEGENGVMGDRSLLFSSLWVQVEKMEVRDLDVVVDFEIAVMAGVYIGEGYEGRRERCYLKIVNIEPTQNTHTLLGLRGMQGPRVVTDHSTYLDNRSYRIIDRRAKCRGWPKRKSV